MAWLGILVFTVFAGASTAIPSRIVGGEPTTIEKYPSVVQVEFQNLFTDVWSHACGGFIITSRHIISAAHCFYGGWFNPNIRRIRAGSSYRNTGGVLVYVDDAFHHPSFEENQFDGDIAVVRLRTALVYSPAIQRTIIAAQNSIIPANLPVRVAGWGRTVQGGDPSAVLRDATVLTINNTLCAERYATLPDIRPITEHMICTGLIDVGGRGSCHGDSGGPLIYANITIGVIFGGAGCGNDTFPEVSTNIGSYTDWIIETAV